MTISRFILGGTASYVLAVLLASTAAHAQDLRYTPTHPNFGGSPFNGANLMNDANAQNKYVDPASKQAGDTQSTGAEFVRQLESRLYSSLANQVADAIFGDNATPSGTITFGDQTVTYSHGLDSVTLTIVDASTGTTTNIEIPTLNTSPLGK
jgi:curli production assembly/transport component CsgF